jgi:hypothetical protein
MPVYRTRIVVPAILLFALVSCATQEPLVPHSAEPLEGVDFSGTWLLRDIDSDDQRDIIRALRRAEGDKSGGQRTRRSSSGRNKSAMVHVFLETGKLLKITQTPYAFFVSVDRSVVEEFRFGEHRDVNVGQIVAERVSGWDGPVYVVETRDKNGVRLIERFWLSDDKLILNREITFRGQKDLVGSAMQFFDRTDRKAVTQESGDGTG